MAFRVKCGACGTAYYAGGTHACKPVKNVVAVKNDVKNGKEHSSATSTERTRKWREANRDKSRDYMRNYMQKRRSHPA